MLLSVFEIRKKFLSFSTVACIPTHFTPRAICTFHLSRLLFIFPFNHKQTSAIKCESLADLETPAEEEIQTQCKIHFAPADIPDPWFEKGDLLNVLPP